MRSIKAIVNGDSVNESDMSEYVKAMNIFKDKNPELLLVEQVKPRSSVYDIDQWSFGKNLPLTEKDEIYEIVEECSSDEELVVSASSVEQVETSDSEVDDGICETCSDSSIDL